jgi:hypothetical protein
LPAEGRKGSRDMITPFTEKIEAVEEFTKDTDRILLGLVRVNDAFVLDLNRNEQLFTGGEDSQGQTITPPYTPFTVFLKRQKGQPTDRVTLKDSGDFHASFEINYLPDGFELYATDQKTRKLISKYGAEIFGLTDPSLQDLINLIGPQLLDYLKRTLL